MATTVIGSLAINPILPIQARGAGSLSFGPVALPLGYSTLVVQFDVQQVQSLTAVLSATVDLALDGVTFTTTQGVGLDLSQSGYVLNGTTLTRNAQDPLGPGPVRVFGLTIPLLRTDLTTRAIRGTLSSSEAVTGGVTLVAY